MLEKSDRKLDFVDISNLSGADQDAAAQARIKSEAETGFNLETETAIRGCLLALAPNTHILTLCVHHICADGWSIGILMEELLTAYHAFAAGEAPQLAELPLQYSDFAVQQQSRLSKPEIEKQTNYWKSTLTARRNYLSCPPIEHAQRCKALTAHISKAKLALI